jgi:hypothetical protein
MLMGSPSEARSAVSISTSAVRSRLEPQEQLNNALAAPARVSQKAGPSTAVATDFREQLCPTITF